MNPYLLQCCQLSRIIWETPDFGLYLLVSRLESDISWIIAQIAISCTLNFPTIKLQIFCVVWATVRTFPYKFWYATVISAIMWLNINCLCATYVDRSQRVFLAQMTSFVLWYDLIYHFFPISSQYLMMWGLTALLLGKWGLKITCPAKKSTRPILMEWTFFNPWWPWQCAGFYMYLTNNEYKFEPITRKCQERTS